MVRYAVTILQKEKREVTISRVVRPQPPTNTPVVSDLLKIAGTIPILHYNVKYDAPVEIWIPEAYPYASPICKITAAQGMLFL